MKMIRRPLPNMEPPEPFNVIYQTAEDGLDDTVKPRLLETGADLDMVMVIDDGDKLVSERSGTQWLLSLKTE